MKRLTAHAIGLALLLLLSCSTPAILGDAPDDEKVRQEVRKLIQQLDDDSSEKRDEATRRLEEIGEPALPLLREAAEKASGAEVRVRARSVIRTIEKSQFGEVARWEGHKTTEVTYAWVTRSALTPDGTQVLTAGADGIRVWDAKTGKPVRTLGAARGGGHLGTGRFRRRQTRHLRRERPGGPRLGSQGREGSRGAAPDTPPASGEPFSPATASRRSPAAGTSRSASGTPKPANRSSCSTASRRTSAAWP